MWYLNVILQCSKCRSSAIRLRCTWNILHLYILVHLLHLSALYNLKMYFECSNVANVGAARSGCVALGIGHVTHHGLPRAAKCWSSWWRGFQQWLQWSSSSSSPRNLYSKYLNGCMAYKQYACLECLSKSKEIHLRGMQHSGAINGMDGIGYIQVV